MAAPAQTLGLLGRGISYSLSPLIHHVSSRWLKRSCSYGIFDLAEEEVAPFLLSFWQQGGAGLNVTTPYKRLVSSLIAGGPQAAVNTLARGSSGWEAFSTDGEGFARALARLGRSLEHFPHIVILGSGGVVTALLSHLRALPQAFAVTLLRRSPDHDPELRSWGQGNIALRLLPFSPANLRAALREGGGKGLCIQATNAPQQGELLEEFVPALEVFAGTLCDLVYGTPSRLWAEAHRRRLPCQDGLPMLIEQARLAQNRWWGESAPYEVIWQEVQAHLAASAGTQ